MDRDPEKEGRSGPQLVRPARGGATAVGLPCANQIVIAGERGYGPSEPCAQRLVLHDAFAENATGAWISFGILEASPNDIRVRFRLPVFAHQTPAEVVAGLVDYQPALYDASPRPYLVVKYVGALYGIQFPTTLYP